MVVLLTLDFKSDNINSFRRPKFQTEYNIVYVPLQFRTTLNHHLLFLKRISL